MDRKEQPQVGTCCANRGNLLQHWVLVELVRAIHKSLLQGGATNPHLLFVDAYSMAPRSGLSSRPDEQNPTGFLFRKVRSSLAQNRKNSFYENAWCSLSPELTDGYPSSASFLLHEWPSRVSMLLCEQDKGTATACTDWLNSRYKHGDVQAYEVHANDWRSRFKEPLNILSVGGEIKPDCVFFSFDPNQYDLHLEHEIGSFRMNNADLSRLDTASKKFPNVPVIAQLSTYSTNGDNGPDAVADEIDRTMKSRGWERSLPIRAKRNNSGHAEDMTSFVFWRHSDLAPFIRDMPSRFSKWSKGIYKYPNVN